jgi:hypothetical protein
MPQRPTEESDNDSPKPPFSLRRLASSFVGRDSTARARRGQCARVLRVASSAIAGRLGSKVHRQGFRIVFGRLGPHRPRSSRGNGQPRGQLGEERIRRSKGRCRFSLLRFYPRSHCVALHLSGAGTQVRQIFSGPAFPSGWTAPGAERAAPHTHRGSACIDPQPKLHKLRARFSAEKTNTGIHRNSLKIEKN